jgi:GHMP kinases C terminal
MRFAESAAQRVFGMIIGTNGQHRGGASRAVDRLESVGRCARRAKPADQPDYCEAGRLLSTAHALLRDQVACSTPLIEECVSRVLAAGAYGAKLSGSGHGGCLFALVPGAAVPASVDDLAVHAVALPRSDPAGLACARPSAARQDARPGETAPCRSGHRSATAPTTCATPPSPYG